jgi:hypothetical protein
VILQVNEMKEWIKKIDDSNIGTLLKNSNKLEKVPVKLDNKMALLIKDIRTEKKNEIPERNSFFDVVRIPAFAALALVILIPLAFLIRNNINYDKLAMTNTGLIPFISFMNGSVAVTNGELSFSVKCGYILKNGDMIKVGNNSACRIIFDKDTSIRLAGNSELQVFDIFNGSNFPKMYLAGGRMNVVSEKSKKSIVLITSTSISDIVSTNADIFSDSSSTLFEVNKGDIRVNYKAEKEKYIFDRTIIHEGDRLSIKKEEILKTMLDNRSETVKSKETNDSAVIDSKAINEMFFECENYIPEISSGVEFSFWKYASNYKVVDAGNGADSVISYDIDIESTGKAAYLQLKYSDFNRDNENKISVYFDGLLKGEIKTIKSTQGWSDFIWDSRRNANIKLGNDIPAGKHSIKMQVPNSVYGLKLDAFRINFADQ